MYPQFFKASALLSHYQIAAKAFVHSNGQMFDVEVCLAQHLFQARLT